MHRSHRIAGASSRRALRSVLAAGLLAVGASFGTAAFAQHGGPMGGPPGMGGPGAGMFMGRPEHMSRMLDRWLDGVNATEAQRTQIRQIAMAAAADLRAQHEAGRGLREESLRLWSAPTVDASAIEALRQRMLAQHDQASKRISQAMVETANVLTPEQRAKVAERMRQRGERMRDRNAPPPPPRNG